MSNEGLLCHKGIPVRHILRIFNTLLEDFNIFPGKILLNLHN